MGIFVKGGGGGGAADGNDAVKVSANDTTPGFLNGKLVAGTNVTFTEGSDGGDETLTIAAAGGVTGFTGSQNTSSPNDTVNASRLLVDATSTNADAVLQPKGTGSLLAQLPDGAATGGNKRGTNAVDLQTYRQTNTRVSSGVYSTIAGGYGNTSSGNSAFSCGQNNLASGASSFAAGADSTASNSRAVAIGNQCVANKEQAVALGDRCTSSGNSAFSVGSLNTASGICSIAIGQRAVADKNSMLAHSGGNFSVSGDCQFERYIQRRTTTDAVQIELSTEGAAPAAATRMSIASDATYTFSGLVTARRTDADNESAGWEIKGVIDNNAGTTALVGSATVTALGDDSSGTWLVSVEADNTNDALVIKVTGEAGKTIRWGATVTLMKVAG